MNERERILEIIEEEQELMWDLGLTDGTRTVIDEMMERIVSGIRTEPEPLVVCKTMELSQIGTKEIKFPVLLDGPVMIKEIMSLQVELGHIFCFSGMSGQFTGPNQNLTITLTPGNGLAAVMQVGPPAKPPGRLLRLWKWLKLDRGE